VASVEHVEHVEHDTRGHHGGTWPPRDVRDLALTTELWNWQRMVHDESIVVSNLTRLDDARTRLLR
jgi:hypothetical protein